VLGSGNVVDTLLYDEWEANTSYEVGDTVIYNGNGKKCITANNDATFTSSKWESLGNTSDACLIVGNASLSGRSNGLKLDWGGNLYLNGDAYVRCNADSSGGTRVAMTTEVAAIDN